MPNCASAPVNPLHAVPGPPTLGLIDLDADLGEITLHEDQDRDTCDDEGSTQKNQLIDLDAPSPVAAGKRKPRPKEIQTKSLQPRLEYQNVRRALTGGTTYEGQVLGNVMMGRGRMLWKDGASYEGEFANDCRNGHGTFRAGGALAGMVYEGQFFHDKMHGEGRCVFADGRKYEGQWSEGHIEGTGKMTWPNGSEYFGEYVKDTKHGQGTFKWPDGRKHEGEWKDGKQEGLGVATDVNGIEKHGKWKQGRLLAMATDKKSQCSSNSSTRGTVDSDKSVATPPSIGAFEAARRDSRSGANKASPKKAADPKAKAAPKADVKHIYWDFRNQGSVEDLPI